MRVWLPAILAGVLVATASGAAKPTGVLAYSSKKSGFWEIWVANADGTGARRVTSDRSQDYSPTWSPDGRRLAYMSSLPCKGLDPGCDYNIWVIDANGTHRRQLTTDGGYLPAWSPDGRRIAYAHVDVSTTDNPVIDVVDPGGGGRTTLGPAWSPKGDVLAVSVPQNGRQQFQLELLSASGGGGQPIPNTGTFAYAPSWAPDGTRIVYVLLAGTEVQLHVVGADGSGDVRIPSGPNDEEPAWSPDGTRIAFTRGGGVSGEVWTMSAGGGGEVRVAKGVTPAWRPQAARR